MAAPAVALLAKQAALCWAAMHAVLASHMQLCPNLLSFAGVAAGPHQPFAAYLVAELHPGPSYPTADVVWGQTERDRVYNALVSVPYQLERFLLFGVALCLDSFLVGWDEGVAGWLGCLLGWAGG